MSSNTTSKDGFMNFEAHGADVESTSSDDHDTGSEGSGAPKLHLHGSDAPQLRRESEPERIEQYIARSAMRGAPSVSPKWANMPCKASEDMSDDELMLLASVQAENLFADGLREKGARIL